MSFLSTPHPPITQEGFNEMRRNFTETFFFALQRKTGSPEALLALTQGQRPGRIENIVENLLYPDTDKDSNVVVLDMAMRFLLDWDALLEALEADTTDCSD